MSGAAEWPKDRRLLVNYEHTVEGDHAPYTDHDERVFRNPDELARWTQEMSAPELPASLSEFKLGTADGYDSYAGRQNDRRFRIVSIGVVSPLVGDDLKEVMAVVNAAKSAKNAAAVAMADAKRLDRAAAMAATARFAAEGALTEKKERLEEYGEMLAPEGVAQFEGQIRSLTDAAELARRSSEEAAASAAAAWAKHAALKEIEELTTHSWV